MKPRRLYWRKKEGKTVLEGRDNKNKPYQLWTLIDADKFYNLILKNAEFLTKEKKEKMAHIYSRLAFKADKRGRKPREVHLLEINRTQKKDAITDDIKKQLWEMSA